MPKFLDPRFKVTAQFWNAVDQLLCLILVKERGGSVLRLIDLNFVLVHSLLHCGLSEAFVLTFVVESVVAHVAKVRLVVCVDDVGVVGSGGAGHIFSF